MAGEFKPEQLTDFLFDFSLGMNAGIAPALLPKNQLANAVNQTVRGTFVRTRPTFRKMQLQYIDSSNVNFPLHKWQGATYFKPDSGNQSLIAITGGNAFKFEITGPATNNVATVSTLFGVSLIATAAQCWAWQSEKWVIFNDGATKPWFYDNSSVTQSNYSVPVHRSEVTTNATTIPAVGANGTVDFSSVVNLAVGDIFTIQYRGTFTVLSISGGVHVSYLNLTGTPTGAVVASGTAVSWTKTGTQLPPGRMGTYGMGRNWVCLPDGKQFVASDCVGGSSGTVANNYRDAVLNVTENSYLAGGGNFTVPGNVGDITAMIFTATLDSSLGQGALQVLTPNTVFSCQAPVDRLTWQDITNPILTQSLIAFGGEAMNSTVNANGDIIMRSIDGIRSLILARKDFNVWGNVPQSREVDPILSQDSSDLLGYGSAIVFDNRLLMTCRPHITFGQFPAVYHQGLIALNFDPLSSLSGKLQSVYDGLWTGLNVLQLVVGRFAGLERAFAFCFNTVNNQNELWEILKDGQADNDDLDGTPMRVIQSAESPTIFKDPDTRSRRYKRLLDGEIHVSDIPPGETVDFQVWYRPDEYPCWIPWRQWSECAGSGTSDQKPQFRPRMGLGEPSPSDCDEVTNRPFREGYYFQVKWIITGTCTFRGAYFKATTMPEPKCAPIICDVPCPPP